MSKRAIIKQDIIVPSGALLEVADILIEEGIMHTITSTDEEEDTITLEIQYEKEQRDAVHAIDDLIGDFEEQEDDNTTDDKD